MKLSRRNFIKGAGLCTAAAITNLAIPKHGSSPFFEHESSSGTSPTKLNNVEANYPERVYTGFEQLDEYLGGLSGGSLTVIGADETASNFSFALSIATQAAHQGTQVMFFSSILSTAHVVESILGMEACGSQFIANGQMDPKEWSKVSEAVQSLSDLPLWIDSCRSGTTMREIRTRAIRQFRDDKPEKGLMIIDDLQFMHPNSEDNDSSRHDNEDISYSLKMLARELNLPIILLSRISKTADLQPGMNSHLYCARLLGTIEQDADIILFLRGYDGNRTQRRNDLIIAKNRYGQAGCLLTFKTNQWTGRFEELGLPPQDLTT